MTESSGVVLGSWVVVGSGEQNCGNNLQTREQYGVLVDWQRRRTLFFHPVLGQLRFFKINDLEIINFDDIVF